MVIGQNEIFQSWKCLVQLGEKHISITLKSNFCGTTVVIRVTDRAKIFKSSILDK